MPLADAGIKHPQEIVDFRDGADRRPRVASGGLLLDADGGREAADEINIRLLHLAEELPCIAGEGFDVPTLSLGIKRVEGQ